jgi:molybdenum cofactor synthesis domain-containing protein
VSRTAVVITVSDSVYQGTRADKSGPAVRAALEEIGWTTAGEVIPDELPMIAARLAELADSGTVSAVFTTGGTGVAARDVTPEATRAVIEREIPGFGEWMRLNGVNSTPLALLSRGLAGTRGDTLIVNLPGSPKGAIESLNSITGLLPHVIELLRGNTEHRS